MEQSHDFEIVENKTTSIIDNVKNLNLGVTEQPFKNISKPL